MARTTRARKAVNYNEDATEDNARAAAAKPVPGNKAAATKKTAGAKRKKVEEEDEDEFEDKEETKEDEDGDEDEVDGKEEESEEETKPAKKRKTNGAAPAAATPVVIKATPKAAAPKAAPKAKAPKAGDVPSPDMALAARTAVSSLAQPLYIGAHVSAAGGVQNALPNALHIGANALALFLKSQRKWSAPPLAQPTIDAFRDACARHAYDPAAHTVPHGSYLVNLAQADAAKAEQAYTSFLDDLARCRALGIRLYNFHPGNTGGAPRAEAIARIAAQLNRAHRDPSTGDVVTVLENMAGAGNVIGTRFEDLRDVIALVDDKERVGVCVDTCHAFAAGYDLRTPEAFAETFDEFERVIGGKYLKAFHLNDSKAPFGSHRDLHANIGTGFLGLRAFHNLMNYSSSPSSSSSSTRLSFLHLPMVLETPLERPDPAKPGKTIEDKQVWADEIKLLESLIGMDADGPAFQALETELQARGQGERERVQAQADKKTGKEKAAAAGGKGRGKKKA